MMIDRQSLQLSNSPTRGENEVKFPSFPDKSPKIRDYVWPCYATKEPVLTSSLRAAGASDGRDDAAGGSDGGSGVLGAVRLRTACRVPSPPPARLRRQSLVNANRQSHRRHLWCFGLPIVLGQGFLSQRKYNTHSGRVQEFYRRARSLGQCRTKNCQ